MNECEVAQLECPGCGRVGSLFMHELGLFVPTGEHRKVTVQRTPRVICADCGFTLEA